MMRLRLFLFVGFDVFERTYSRFPVRIGRHPDNECQILDSRVSRFHAQLECDGGSLVLRDVDSQNGTCLVEGLTCRVLRGRDTRSPDGNIAFLVGTARLEARFEETSDPFRPDEQSLGWRRRHDVLSDSGSLSPSSGQPS